jgi:thymidylate synthase (FAD)
MKFIKPYYKILSKIKGKEILQNIERAGRTCYKSEDRITDESAEKFIKMLIERGHESVLEHETISILFTCDRGVSHEIVRHRLASFSQESTRYCNYSSDKFENQLTFIIPEWLDIEECQVASINQALVYCKSPVKGTTPTWLNSMLHAEHSYNHLINNGWESQQARSILPNSLKTEIVVTANIREWRTIFKQRTTKAAHPQMRELMCPLLDELKTIIPIVFNDIIY